MPEIVHFGAQNVTCRRPKVNLCRQAAKSHPKSPKSLLCGPVWVSFGDMTRSDAPGPGRIPFRFGLAALVFTTLACAHNPERLPRVDRQFYYNLESDQDKHDFLRTKSKDRQAFLEKRGLWQQWTELSDEEKRAVAAGKVEVGHSAFSAHMAWGPPADVRQVDKRNRTVSFETYIRCTSGPKAGRYVHRNVDCDGTSSEVQLAIENGKVTEKKYLD